MTVEELFHVLRPSISASHDVAFCRTLMSAILDLSVLKQPHQRLTVRHPSENVWSIRGVIYLFVPDINDDLIFELEKRKRRTADLVIITFPEINMSLQRILESIHSKKLPPVFSIDDFLAFRVSFARIDSGYSTQQLMEWILHKYNLVACASGRMDVYLGGLRVSIDREGRSNAKLLLPSISTNPNAPA